MHAHKISPPLTIVPYPDNLPEQAMLLLKDGICIVDEFATVLYCNLACKDLMEKHLQKVAEKGTSLLDALPADRKHVHEYHIKKALQGTPSHYEFMTGISGYEKWLQLEYFAMPSIQYPVRIICIQVSDITESVRLRHILETEQKNHQKQILKAAIDAEDKQREQIGRELHDNVNQVLTTIKLYAEICQKDESHTKSLLNKIVLRSNYCIEEIRKLSRKLSSPNVQEQCLSEMMQNLVESIRATQKAVIRFRSSGIEGKALSQELQTVIYRITQEQLTNILKYAGASIIDIILVCFENTIALHIQDNGKGFVYDEDCKSSGLTNMISRTEMVGGHIRIETSPGKGCSVIAEFPL